MPITEPVSPSTITPATLLTPPADLFSLRAARLRFLANGHSLGPWLNWLADLSDAQQQALNTVEDLQLHAEGFLDSTQPLLSYSNASLRERGQGIYAQLSAASLNFGQCNNAACSTATHSAHPAPQSSELLDPKGAQCIALATGHAEQGQRDVSDILMAAAMQVAWTAGARQLALPEVFHLERLDLCPCCGSAPVASIVMAGEGKSGLRYLQCCLCSTRWNAVRARCTLCDEGSVVHYFGIEGGREAVQAETCDHCHGYIKTFCQSKDNHLDPVADDLASLALDVLVGEQGFARGAPNLLLSEGETVST